MRIQVKRIGDNGNATIGALYIDGIFRCFTIEDEERAEKVAGETRVPNGIYQVSLRKEGGYHERYIEKYGSMHRGMLCIHNKDNWVLENDGLRFQYILIHTGNTEKHTAGCLLLNYAADAMTFTGSNSGNCYKALYPEIADAVEAGMVTIEYSDVEDGK